MDGGAWWATVHGVAKSRTRLSDFTFTFTHFYIQSRWDFCYELHWICRSIWRVHHLFFFFLIFYSFISHVFPILNPPPSLGFSRQEHWSRLPFPSPMHESESEVAQSCPTLRDPMDCSLPGSSVHGIFQARVLEWDTILTYYFFIFSLVFHSLQPVHVRMALGS